MMFSLCQSLAGHDQPSLFPLYRSCCALQYKAKHGHVGNYSYVAYMMTLSLIHWGWLSILIFIFQKIGFQAQQYEPLPSSDEESEESYASSNIHLKTKAKIKRRVGGIELSIATWI